MKILILGAKGNLGEQLEKIFSSSKNEVIAWDKEEVDITDQDLIMKKVKDIKPDIIINATGYNAVDKCEEDQDEYEVAKKLNSEAVGYLVAAALENKATIVNYSTDYVFSGNKKEGYKENDKPAPVSKYGETKLRGEKEILKKSNEGLKYYLIRTSKLFGPRASSPAAKPSFFDLVLQLSKKKGRLDLVDEEMSCFTYTPDLAKATRDLIKNRKSFGIYHIINSGPCTWYEAGQELFKIAGINIKVNPVSADKFPRPAKRPKYSVLLNTKLEPLRDWREALKEYLKK